MKVYTFLLEAPRFIYFFHAGEEGYGHVWAPTELAGDVVMGYFTLQLQKLQGVIALSILLM